MEIPSITCFSALETCDVWRFQPLPPVRLAQAAIIRRYFPRASYTRLDWSAAWAWLRQGFLSGFTLIGFLLIYSDWLHFGPCFLQVSDGMLDAMPHSQPARATTRSEGFRPAAGVTASQH